MPSNSRTHDADRRHDRFVRARPIARRTAIKGFALGLGWLGGALPAGAIRADEPALALAPPDRALADLGARLAVEHPALADRLADGVARELARLRGAAGAAAIARQAYLSPGRTRAELARGDVVLVDGWMLARSEAALSAYLHRLVAAG